MCYRIKTKMSFPLITAANTSQRLRLLFPVLIIYYLLIILSYEVEAANNINVGAIINVNSRIGKEQKTAMKIAAETFNNHSKTHKLILHFRDSGRDPLLAASSAEELIKKERVEVLIGMETWQEASLVADVGNRAQVPVISFAAPAITPPRMQVRWPFLIRMASNASAQMKCIADIVSAYNWKRVVVIYEDDGFGGDVGMLALFTEALQDVGSKIEHRLVLTPVSSLSNPNWVELEELLKLPTIQSRVFIVLQSSLPTVTQLFRVAKQMGLVGRDSAWIVTESITSLLDSLDNSDISNMKGTLGIKTYAKHTSAYVNFQKIYQTMYPEEDKSKPGIFALRAYDGIRIITQAIRRMTNNSTTSLQVLLNAVLRNYIGLSGKMCCKGGKVLCSPILRLINIVDGKRYKELDFWIPEVGFSESFVIETGKNVGGVIWPGNLTSAPKGWAMPTDAKRMKIGVPGKTSFNTFVKVDSGANSDEKTYDGFCIRVFYKILHRLNYSLPYDFVALNCTYDDMVEQVHNKVTTLSLFFLCKSPCASCNHSSVPPYVTASPCKCNSYCASKRSNSTETEDKDS